MIRTGDCLELMRELDDCSIDAIVTDPPYGLSEEPDVVEVLTHWLAGDDYKHRGGGFMGKTWDSFVPGPATWREAYRVLKPGGHLLAFGGTRTYDLLVVALRIADFEIRDTVAWLYGSGFPKSLNVPKAIDDALGVEGTWRREDHAGRPGARKRDTAIIGQVNHATTEANPDGLRHVYEPASEEGRAWADWGTALKPAHEPIVLARKPLGGTVARGLLEHGTGALNIGGSRVDFRDEADERASKAKNAHGDFGSGARENRVYGEDRRPRVDYAAPARWPANVVMDEDAGELLDEQAGVRSPGNHPGMRSGRDDEKVYGSGWSSGTNGSARRTESGGASRFFYCPKASRYERDAGLESFERRPLNWSSGDQSPGTFQSEGTDKTAKNAHPTVKPIRLMIWLATMITPPGGTILDPFVGSGTTGVAAALRGFDFIGYELEAEHVAWATARIAWWAEKGDSALEPPPSKVAQVSDEQMALSL